MPLAGRESPSESPEADARTLSEPSDVNPAVRAEKWQFRDTLPKFRVSGAENPAPVAHYRLSE
jgi:hypothetical protein